MQRVMSRDAHELCPQHLRQRTLSSCTAKIDVTFCLILLNWQWPPCWEGKLRCHERNAGEGIGRVCGITR